LFFCCALLWAAAPIAAVEGWHAPPKSQPAAAAAETAIKPADEQVKAWLAELARQEAFADWDQAEFRLYPLGPGTHGWAAILERGGEEIGYLIISATPDGDYQLLEYGTGAYPLFSWNTLHRSLMQWGLIPESWTAEDLARESERPGSPVAAERRYEPPLLAVWEIVSEDGSKYIFDAKTGEGYPPFEFAGGGADGRPALLAGDSDVSIHIAKKLKEVQVEVFDPFADLFWVKNVDKHAAADLNAILNHLEAGEKVVYTTRILGGEVTLPFAVIGAHVWGERDAAVMLDHYGPRLLAYEALANAGVFHLE
jgi:hypothetical protein